MCTEIKHLWDILVKTITLKQIETQSKQIINSVEDVSYGNID